MKGRAIVLTAAFTLLVSAGQAGGTAAHASPLSTQGAQGAPTTIVVPRDFPTIQAAVNAAAPGSTINIKSGTYTEEVVIAKDLNLRVRAPARR
jgi:pectin methylesterase-like acyl-CoA thioesterase